MMTGQFISLITSLEQVSRGEPVDLDSLAEKLNCREPLGDCRDFAAGISDHVITSWRELIEQVPLDSRSFSDTYQSRSLEDFVRNLKDWCDSFKKESHDTKTKYATLYGFLAFLLVTMIALTESDARRGLNEPRNYSADEVGTERENPDDLCARYIRENAVRSVVRALYRPVKIYSVAEEDFLDADSGEWQRGQTEWHSLDFRTLTFHRYGTTSIILRVRGYKSSESYALKLILLPFLRFKAIGRETLNYGRRYNPSSEDRNKASVGSPDEARRSEPDFVDTERDSSDQKADLTIRIVTVVASSYRWILMNFIKGLTLGELLSHPKLIDAFVSVNKGYKGTDLWKNDKSISDVLRMELGSYPLSELRDAGLEVKSYEDLNDAGIDPLYTCYVKLTNGGNEDDDGKKKKGKKKKSKKKGDAVDDALTIELDWLFNIGGALFDAIKDVGARASISNDQRSTDGDSESESDDDARELALGTSHIHGDLTPSNIIVNDELGFRLTLIDLGRNYFYTQSIVGGGQDDAIFVAPEIREDRPPFDYADVYSIGQLLQLIAARGVQPQRIVFDGFYNRTPLIARFLEDLIQQQRKSRLLIFKPTRGDSSTECDGKVSPGQEKSARRRRSGFRPRQTHVDMEAEISEKSVPPGDAAVDYEHLKTIFQQEVEAVKLADNEGKGAAGDWMDVKREVLHPLDGALRRQRKLFKNRSGHIAYKEKEIGGYSRALFWYSLISTLAIGLAFAAVSAWFLRDLGFSWTDRGIEVLQKVKHSTSSVTFPVVDSWRAADYHIPDLRHNWPAWVVGFSYCLVEAKLYQGIFSGLMPLLGPRRGRLRWQAILAELGMRIHTIAAPVLVMTVVLFQSRSWPIATAIGQIFAALSNVAIYRYSVNAINDARDDHIITAGPRGTRIPGLDLLKQWVPSSAFYALIVSVIAILIYIHVLHDVGLDAVAVAAINVGLFYYVKFSLAGPPIRVGIARACLAAERIRREGDASYKIDRLGDNERSSKAAGEAAQTEVPVSRPTSATL